MNPLALVASCGLITIIILSLNPLTYAQSNNKSDSPEDKENLSQMNSQINSLITWSVGGSGIVTFIWGVYEYRKNRILKRQEILFGLIQEFDKDLDTQPNKMKDAKILLDDFNIDKYGKSYEHENMKEILRYHGKREDDDYDPIDRKVDDKGEIEIRASFDELLNYFGKLGYLLDRGLVKKDEIRYFEYYIKKAVKNEAVMRYARLYEFENFALLLVKMEPFARYLLNTKSPSGRKAYNWIKEQNIINKKRFDNIQYIV